MLLKCCTQYTSKFGKLSGGHRTGKCQFLFQPQRKAMPKNVQLMNCIHFTSQQDYAQNPSSWALAAHELRTSTYTSWIQKRQRKQVKSPTSTRSQKNQRNSTKIQFCFTDYAKAFDCVDHSKLWEILGESVSCSVMSDSLPTHGPAWAPLSMEFSREEYWNGSPFPSPGDLPNPGIKPRSPALQADTLLSEPPNDSLQWKVSDV